mmetsp:Transcript_15304/g.33075  ORF Transcript_15304/g.33075 Transcript_15304/m.33075 type:complete len:109 (+) Transcript_15304:118-444(+)
MRAHLSLYSQNKMEACHTTKCYEVTVDISSGMNGSSQTNSHGLEGLMWLSEGNPPLVRLFFIIQTPSPPSPMIRALLGQSPRDVHFNELPSRVTYFNDQEEYLSSPGA